MLTRVCIKCYGSSRAIADAGSDDARPMNADNADAMMMMPVCQLIVEREPMLA